MQTEIKPATPLPDSRRIDYDLLTTLACLAVVFLHCSNSVYHVADTAEWRTSLLIQSLAMWCVPVFFMLSGANLLTYRSRYPTAVYFRKRVVRTLVPLLFWSTVHLLRQVAGGTLVIRSLQDLINVYTQGLAEPTYWFFYALFAVYLVIPLLSAADPVKNRRLFWYLFGLCFAASALLPLLSRFAGIGLNKSVLANFAGHLGYALLGYLLSTARISNRLRLVAAAAGILACAGLYWGTWALNIGRAGVTQLDKQFMTFSSVNNYLMAAAVFLIVTGIDWQAFLGDTARKIIAELSRISFGIYLVHKLLLYLAYAIWAPDVTSLAFKTAGALALYLVSAGCVLLIRKIPVLKLTIP